jgi:hypothetical protein
MVRLTLIVSLVAALALPASTAFSRPKRPKTSKRVKKAKKAKKAEKARKARKAKEAKEAFASFRKGQELFEAADYVGAVEAFTKAYRLKPHYSVLCNIALCFERNNQLIKATEHYERCLLEGGKDTGEAASVRNSLARVRKLITWVTVASKEPGAEIFLDGQPVGLTPKRIPVNPGRRVIEVRRTGAKPARIAFKTRGGERTMELDPVPIIETKTEVTETEVAVTGTGEPPRRRLSQVWFWGTAGLTVAFAAVTTILGVQTLSLRKDFDETPTVDLADQGEQRRVLTNVFLGLTAAAAGTSTVLFFYTDFPWTRERADDEGDQELSLVVGLRGTF